MIATLTIVVPFAATPKEERMGATSVPAGILLAVAVGIVFVVLKWAAEVRGRIHREFVRHNRGVQLTMSAVAGCGMA